MKTVDIVKKDIADGVNSLDEKYYPAFLEGVLRGKADLNLGRNGVELEITTDNVRLAEIVANLLLKMGFDDITIEEHVKKTTRFERIYVTIDMTAKDTSLLFKKCNMPLTEYSIPEGLSEDVKTDFFASTAFLKGLFFASGSISIPETAESKQGYHLELQLSTKNDCEEVVQLLKSTDIAPHASIAKRKKNLPYYIERKDDSPEFAYSVYVKSKEEISDFVAALGSPSTVLNIQKIIIRREERNRANRKENCDMANIDRTVNASTEIIMCIKKIEREKGLKSLPSPLYETAIARLNNPELTLNQLLEVLKDPPTKSGLQHRLQKIKSIAEKL